MRKENQTSWAAEEFADVNFGDKRLDARLVTLCDRFSDSPESPINQACADWAETNAAYRFFRNESVEADKILATHRRKTSQRAQDHDTVLALQDTSYFVYTSHMKTEGLGEMSMKKGKNVEKIYSKGLVMHACLAITTQGLPLGLLDQNIFARKLRPEHQRRRKGGRYIQDVLPVEEKETYRWLQALKATEKALPDTRVEACRLGHAQRLTRYLMIMSIVAWRLFMITLIARSAPDTPCTSFLAENEWKVLFRRTHRNAPPPLEPPCAADAVVWIARLGGFLARKGDGPPGTITLWRGWKRLTDLAEGWNLAAQGDTCG